MTTLTTVFVCTGQRVIAEYTGGTAASSAERKYLYASYIDERCVMVDRTALGVLLAGIEELFYYHCNNLYSHTALTDSLGVVVERYAYETYGNILFLNALGIPLLTQQSTVGNPYTYTGRRLDDETGLYYYRARYYDSQLGRFIGRDPIGYGDGLNMYSYVGGAPLVMVDPTGEWRKTLVDVYMQWSNMQGCFLVRHYVKEHEWFDWIPGKGWIDFTFMEHEEHVKTKVALCKKECTREGLAKLYAEKSATPQGLRIRNILSLGEALLVGQNSATVTMEGFLAEAAGISLVGAVRATKTAAHIEREANIARGIPENQLGPSGKPKIHTVDHPSLKAAKDTARARVGKGGGVEKHSSPRVGKPHYHGVKPDGTKVRVHDTYPRNE